MSKKEFAFICRKILIIPDMNNTFPTEGNLSGLSRKDFQKEINDKETDLFILKNKKGMEVAVTNYGCAIL